MFKKTTLVMNKNGSLKFNIFATLDNYIIKHAFNKNR